MKDTKDNLYREDGRQVFHKDDAASPAKEEALKEETPKKAPHKEKA